MRIAGIALLTLLLTGCIFPGGEQIKDFSDRSVGYGWLDIDDVDANRLHAVVIYQYVPKSSEPYYHVAVKKFEGGYLYYSFAFAKGAYGTYSATGQQCFLLCGNTIYTYDFGKQGGSTAKVRIEQPGVYNFGSYQLREIKTGFFEQDKFEAVAAKNAPSDAQMLQEILKDAGDNPVMAERIRAALKQYEG